MTGLGRRRTERVVRLSKPCPEDIDGVLDAVRQILLTGNIQSLTLRAGEPIVYERLVSPDEEIAARDSTECFAELTPFEVVRNVPMEEFLYSNYGDAEKATPHEKVMWAFMNLAHDGWAVTHLLLGPRTKFWGWLGIKQPFVKDIKYFYNAKVEYDKNVPEDVFVLCGASTRHATIAEIGCSLKCSVD